MARMKPGRLRVVAAVAVFLGVSLAALEQSASPTTEPVSVFVVAVKDSGILTMCPALREVTLGAGWTWRPDGRAVVTPHGEDLQLLRFPARAPSGEDRRGGRESPALARFRTELSVTQVVLPLPASAADENRVAAATGATELGRSFLAADPELRHAVESEFARQGRYRIAAALDGADVVFFVEGSYVALAAASTRDTGQPDLAPPPLISSAQMGDWPRNLLQSTLAIAVPAAAYRAGRGDISTFMASRIWEGSEVAQPPYQTRSRAADGAIRWETDWTWRSASPSALVSQFAGAKPRPASHPPLCAATTQPFQGIDVESISASRGDVPPVSVAVSVTDGQGRAILGLDSSRFRVYEDDSLQVVHQVLPAGQQVDVTVLRDTSSSMSRKLRDTQAATFTALQVFGRIGRAAVTSFDRRIVVQPASRDLYDARRADTNQTSIGRTATRFYDALILLLAGPLTTGRDRSALVVLTDGVDTASRLADAGTARRRLMESQVPAYVLFYNTSEDTAPVPPDGGISLVVGGKSPNLVSRLVPEGADNPRPAYERAKEFLREIAELTGGRLYPALSSEDVQRALAEIATELSQQYTVTYSPSNKAREGTYRRIRIEVDAPDARVKARPGYYSQD